MKVQIRLRRLFVHVMLKFELQSKFTGIRRRRKFHRQMLQMCVCRQIDIKENLLLQLISREGQRLQFLVLHHRTVPVLTAALISHLFTQTRVQVHVISFDLSLTTTRFRVQRLHRLLQTRFIRLTTALGFDITGDRVQHALVMIGAVNDAVLLEQS